MDRDMVTNVDSVIYGSDKVRSVSATGCSNNKLSTNYEIISLGSEYKNQLLSIVINNYNLLFGLSPTPFEFPVLIYYINQLNLLYSFICKIRNVSNSKCKCECTCQCICSSKPSFTGNTICLCLCDCTQGQKTNGCCVCICKKKDCSCKCICICVCNKNGGKCCCNGQKHTCKQPLVKVDINSLLIQTWKISGHLNCIKCYISRTENQSGSSNTCCCCICCVNGSCNSQSCQSYCCCKEGAINYVSIISRISIVVILFKEVGKKILDLTKLYKTPPLKYIIENKYKPCESCGCKDKLKEFIEKIQKAVDYYSSFASIIGDIKSLVDYKTFCPQANEIIEKLKMSVKPLLNQLTEINSQVLINVDLTRISDQLLLGVYSHYCIFQCFLAMYILLQSSSKIYSILYINQIVENCLCVGNFKPNNNSFKTTDFHKYLINCCGKNLEDTSKLFINNDGNHMCLCLVIKYVLYPSLIKSFFYMRGIYYEGITKQTREFTQMSLKDIQEIDVTKMLFIIMNLMYKISMFMERRYLWITSKIKSVHDAFCFCRAPEDKYYPYMISIILYVSSLMENIWSMDNLSIVSAIDCVSSLLSEYQSIDDNSHYTVLEQLEDSKISMRSRVDYGGVVDPSQPLLDFQIDIKYTISLFGDIFSIWFKFDILELDFPPIFILAYNYFFNITFSLDNILHILKKSFNLVTLGIDSIVSNFLLIISKVKFKSISKDCDCNKKCGKKLIMKTAVELMYNRCILITKYILKDMRLDILIPSSMSKNITINKLNHMMIKYIRCWMVITKNNLITHPNYGSNYITISNTGIGRSNWGYDTKYEHDVITDKGFSKGDGYPNLLSDPRYTFSPLSLFLNNCPYNCIISKCNP